MHSVKTVSSDALGSAPVYFTYWTRSPTPQRGSTPVYSLLRKQPGDICKQSFFGINPLNLCFRKHLVVLGAQLYKRYGLQHRAHLQKTKMCKNLLLFFSLNY